MRQFKVKCVVKDPFISSYKVILESIDDSTLLPLPVGPFEAEAIFYVLSSLKKPRPMTYDLMTNILRQLGDVTVNRMFIDTFDDGIFTAKLELNHSGNTLIIDCRPSDGIALSLRMNYPIFIDEHVVQRKKCVSKSCLNEHEKALLEQILMDQEVTYL
ncbi:bifunctional nuclease family protein [Calditerrivibrio nitroreducens]|uniref:BFN domain-containing protein n=1 Tax=Calditerrivibrio nitroreducens (strain DSM 19672 / NBRC 101217 / Yu37-1) TaxID=768670 RepID=E4TGN3_CALNY|nr:bifunctional nuclease family protein [Calditerrivibrio nitroreducens]ADR19746.1 protein of unknown function DUF151 [Calditerrivibrio nitroreducens DSM 19672]